jgi:hypothetical protein
MKSDPIPHNPPKPPKCSKCGLFQGFAGMHTRTCTCSDYLEKLIKPFNWNKLTLDEMAEYLRKKYMLSSSGDAKCIYHLIEFYDKHK